MWNFLSLFNTIQVGALIWNRMGKISTIINANTFLHKKFLPLPSSPLGRDSNMHDFIVEPSQDQKTAMNCLLFVTLYTNPSRTWIGWGKKSVEQSPSESNYQCPR